MPATREGAWISGGEGQLPAPPEETRKFPTTQAESHRPGESKEAEINQVISPVNAKRNIDKNRHVSNDGDWSSLLKLNREQDKIEADC